MKKLLVTSCLYTLATAVGLGLVYPLFITGVAQIAFRDKANGQLITSDGQLIGSRLIGQPFTGPGFFHSRPSAAGTGYDATSSSGSNLAATSQALAERVSKGVSAASTGSPVPIDLVTSSGSGLDPDVTPAAALYQVPRVASERRVSEETVRKLVLEHIRQRQLGLLGEPRVNVLELNLALADMEH
jgi:potassium-transporting ATPase KdpC subunit